MLVAAAVARPCANFIDTVWYARTRLGALYVPRCTVEWLSSIHGWKWSADRIPMHPDVLLLDGTVVQIPSRWILAPLSASLCLLPYAHIRNQKLPLLSFWYPGSSSGGGTCLKRWIVLLYEGTCNVTEPSIKNKKTACACSYQTRRLRSRAIAIKACAVRACMRGHAPALTIVQCMRRVPRDCIIFCTVEHAWCMQCYNHVSIYVHI
jgi:hypothetical protein